MLRPIERDDVFSELECDQIIRIVESRLFSDAGLVRGEKIDNIRRARIAWIDEQGEAEWVFARVVETAIAANRAHFAFDLNAFSEKAQIAWYDSDHGGHFDWHVDIGDGPLAARRKLTLVVQLSAAEAYEGGALEINADGHGRPASRRRGAAILFPSFMPHRVTPVGRGQRYSLTTWVHGPAFR